VVKQVKQEIVYLVSSVTGKEGFESPLESTLYKCGGETVLVLVVELHPGTGNSPHPRIEATLANPIGG
jgi:hypothetical protein